MLLVMPVVYLFSPTSAFAQVEALYLPQEGRTNTKDDQPFFLKLFNELELRQSFGSVEMKREPVRFQFTLPDDHENSFLIDGALGIPFFDAALTRGLQMTGKLIGEYHRNTLLDEEQYTWQAGFSTAIRTKIHKNSAKTRYSQFIFSPTIKYSRNVLDTISSLLFTLDIMPFVSKTKGVNLGTYTIRGNRKLIHLLSVIPAFEFQNNYSAQNDSDDGRILRPAIKMQYSIGGNKIRVPLSRMVEPVKTWEASIDYTLRYAVINSTLNREEFSNLLETGVNYYFLTSPVSISFGVSYNYGSDPMQGLNKQKFWLATLCIQK